MVVLWEPSSTSAGGGPGAQGSPRKQATMSSFLYERAAMAASMLPGRARFILGSDWSLWREK